MDCTTTTANSSGVGGTSGTLKGVPGETLTKEASLCDRVLDSSICEDFQRSTKKFLMQAQEFSDNSRFRNVKLTFPIRNGAIYTPAEILKGVLQIIPAEKIEGLGVLSAITEWNLLVSDLISANALICTRRVTLPDGTTGTATQVRKTEAIIRVQWLPMSVPDRKIRSLLEPFGIIDEFEWEVYAEPEMSGIRNGVRRIRLTLKDGVTKDDLPHRTTLEGDAVLFTVFGRKPRCLRCGTAGHFFKNCPRRGKNKPTFAEKVRGPPKSAGKEGTTEPVSPPTPEPVSAEIPPLAEDQVTLLKRYEEVALPLLNELKQLTAEDPKPVDMEVYLEPDKKETESVAGKNSGEPQSPQKKSTDDLPKSDNSKKRPRNPSPPMGKLWADQMDSDADSVASSRSSRKSTANRRRSANQPRKPEDAALERLLAQRKRILSSTDHMDSPLRARVMEVMQCYQDDALEICGYMIPGTTYKKFKKKAYGIYQELRLMEQLYADYRDAKVGNDLETQLEFMAAAMDDE